MKSSPSAEDSELPSWDIGSLFRWEGDLLVGDFFDGVVFDGVVIVSIASFTPCFTPSCTAIPTPRRRSEVSSDESCGPSKYVCTKILANTHSARSHKISNVQRSISCARGGWTSCSVIVRGAFHVAVDVFAILQFLSRWIVLNTTVTYCDRAKVVDLDGLQSLSQYIIFNAEATYGDRPGISRWVFRHVHVLVRKLIPIAQ